MIKIRLNESQLFGLLIEASSLDDIYIKYYSGIDREVFNKIVSSDPTWREDKPNKMGKFGKWLLGLYIARRLKLEDLYKAKEYLGYFVKYNNRIEIKDINKYKSLNDLYGVVKVFMDNPEISVSHGDDIRRIKEGAEKVYEDGEWLVIIPHTQEASCYYGKGTQWCTAADKSNNMFDHYNDQGNLYINIRKSDGEKFQFHFESDSFMDATDTPIESPIYEEIGLSDGILGFYKNNVETSYYNKLVEKRVEIYVNDSGYIVYYCTSPFSDSAYIYDGDHDEVIADRLVKGGDKLIRQICHTMDKYDYFVCDNLYGYKTMVAMDTNGYLDKISDTLIDVDSIEDLFGIEDDSKCMAYIVDKSGIAEIYNYGHGYALYKTSADLIKSRGYLDQSTIYFEKKNDTYDLFDVYSGESLEGLLPFDDLHPWYKEHNNDTYETYIYMRNEDGVKIRINLDESLSYEEIYDEDEFDYDSMY